MKYTLILAAAMLVFAGQAATAASDDSRIIHAIRSAPDPSAAVAAYARGLSADELPAVQRAYVARMSELGRPDMAMEQASAVLRNDSTFGLGWAVVAYNLVGQGRATEAFTDIIAAGRLSPSDRFVARTAGQLSALYDSAVVQRSNLSAAVRDGMAALRLKYAENPVFTEAYRQAQSAYYNRFGPPLPDRQPQEQRVTIVNSPPETGTTGGYPLQYPLYPQEYYPVGSGAYGGGGYSGGGGGGGTGCLNDFDGFNRRRYNFVLPQFDPSENFVTNKVPLTKQELARQSIRFNNNYLYFDQDDFTTSNGQLVLRPGDNLANHLYQLTDSSIRLRYTDFTLAGNTIQLQPLVAKQSGLINGALDMSFRAGLAFIPVEQRPGYALSRGLSGSSSFVGAGQILFPTGWSTIGGDARNAAADVPTVIDSHGFVSVATPPAGTVVVDNNGQLQLVSLQQLPNSSTGGIILPGTIWVMRDTTGQTVNNDDQTLLTVSGAPTVDTISGNRSIRISGQPNGYFSGAPVVTPGSYPEATPLADIGSNIETTADVSSRNLTRVSGFGRHGNHPTGMWQSRTTAVSGMRTVGPAVSGMRTVGPAVSGMRTVGPAVSGGLGRPAATVRPGAHGGGRSGGHGSGGRGR